MAAAALSSAFTHKEIKEIKQSIETGLNGMRRVLTEKIPGNVDSVETKTIQVSKDGEVTYQDRSGVTQSGKIEWVRTHDTFADDITKRSESGRMFLYVIDMQNDFVEGGSFGVQGGKVVGKKICKFVDEMNRLYGERLHIRVTRDYHPPVTPSDRNVMLSQRSEGEDGHCSFYQQKGSPAPGFPKHCEQRTPGTLLLDNIHDKMTEMRNSHRRDVLAMVKGIRTHNDCFAGFPYQTEESFTASQLHGCADEHHIKMSDEHDKKIYTQTGGHVIEGHDMLEYNEVTPDVGVYTHVSPEEHLPGITDDDVVVVTGLAADYCVLNTAANIRDYLKNKGINSPVYVPQQLTRYPLIPYIAIGDGYEEFIKTDGIHSRKPKIVNPDNLEGSDRKPGVGDSVEFDTSDPTRVTWKGNEYIITGDPKLTLGFYATADFKKIADSYGRNMMLVGFPTDETDMVARGRKKRKTRKNRKNKKKSSTRRRNRRNKKMSVRRNKKKSRRRR
jgi:nicotinamidase-related amidase